MARIDRRNRLALDESYRYYRSIEAGKPPELFALSRCLNNVSTALFQSHGSEFKLTRQLWKRLQEALFDSYITNFVGTFEIRDSEGRPIKPGQMWPEQGVLSFRPEGCRRAEDIAEIELKRLYPSTFRGLEMLWKRQQSSVDPSAFSKEMSCDDGVCVMRPMVVGHEVLNAESSAGKAVAYQKWWELYWQAYCTARRTERVVLYRSMMELEVVWGDLYY
jgi:hypothetical protein